MPSFVLNLQSTRIFWFLTWLSSVDEMSCLLVILGLTRKLIDDELGADHAAKGAAQFGELCFGNIVRQAADKKFHAFLSLQGGSKQKLFRYRWIRPERDVCQEKKMLDGILLKDTGCHPVWQGNNCMSFRTCTQNSSPSPTPCSIENPLYA